jgi:hypothetical protein
MLLILQLLVGGKRCLLHVLAVQMVVLVLIASPFCGV